MSTLADLRKGASNLLAEKDDMAEFFGRLDTKPMRVIDAARLPRGKELGTRLDLTNREARTFFDKEIKPLALKELPAFLGMRIATFRLNKKLYAVIEESPTIVYIASSERARALISEVRVDDP